MRNIHGFANPGKLLGIGNLVSLFFALELLIDQKYATTSRDAKGGCSHWRVKRLAGTGQCLGPRSITLVHLLVAVVFGHPAAVARIGRAVARNGAAHAS